DLLFSSSHSSPVHRLLHSFPTRRSSDLIAGFSRPLTASRLSRMISPSRRSRLMRENRRLSGSTRRASAETAVLCWYVAESRISRSEEHTSELQSLAYLVCRLLLEKKNSD